MLLVFFLIAIATAQNNRNLRLPCDQENPPTCVKIEYSIYGYNQISDCSVLKSENTQKTNAHTFLCNNMIKTFVTDNCLNLTNYPTDCFVNVGNRINSIYKQNLVICRNLNTFFNLTNNTQTDNIRKTCNEVQFIEPWYSSVILVMLVMGACAIALCCLCMCCYHGCISIKQSITDFKQRPLTVFRTVTQ
jgi:hypothetical protein